jgi:hypothetical protein
MKNYYLEVTAVNLWIFNQNTQMLYLAVNNITEMKKKVEIDLEHIGPIVGKVIEKQNNDLMATMIICLENQKKEMLLPLKNCLKMMNTIPSSLEDTKKVLSLIIKDQEVEVESRMNKFNDISDLIEK